MNNWIQENWLRIAITVIVVALMWQFFGYENTASSSREVSTLSQDIVCKDYYLENETSAWNERSILPANSRDTFSDLIIFYSPKLDACIKVEQIISNHSDSLVNFVATFYNLNTNQILDQYSEFGYIQPRETEKYVHSALASMQDHIDELRGF
jgi:hypothetical protein